MMPSLISLPPEILAQISADVVGEHTIYLYLTTGPGLFIKHHSHPPGRGNNFFTPGFLRTCRLIHSIATPVWYERTMFDMDTTYNHAVAKPVPAYKSLDTAAARGMLCRMKYMQLSLCKPPQGNVGEWQEVVRRVNALWSAAQGGVGLKTLGMDLYPEVAGERVGPIHVRQGLAGIRFCGIVCVNVWGGEEIGEDEVEWRSIEGASPGLKLKVIYW